MNDMDVLNCKDIIRYLPKVSIRDNKVSIIRNTVAVQQETMFRLRANDTLSYVRLVEVKYIFFSSSHNVNTTLSLSDCDKSYLPADKNDATS